MIGPIDPGAVYGPGDDDVIRRFVELDNMDDNDIEMFSPPEIERRGGGVRPLPGDDLFSSDQYGLIRRDATESKDDTVLQESKDDPFFQDDMPVLFDNEDDVHVPPEWDLDTFETPAVKKLRGSDYPPGTVLPWTYLLYRDPNCGPANTVSSWQTAMKAGPVSLICRDHDIAYSRASTMDDVRSADARMLRSLTLLPSSVRNSFAVRNIFRIINSGLGEHWARLTLPFDGGRNRVEQRGEKRSPSGSLEHTPKPKKKRS